MREADECDAIIGAVLWSPCRQYLFTHSLERSSEAKLSVG